MKSNVEDVMTRNVVAVRETAGYKSIVAAMRRRGVSAFPVLDTADHVVGVVSEADLLFKEVGPEPFTGPARSVLATGRRGERAKAAAVTAAGLMSTPAITIGPGKSVADAARLMCARRVKRLPVIDDDGSLAGIVSRVDVLSVFDRPDEQIRDDVLKNIVAGEFALNPLAFDVAVKSGIVTITGQVERRAIAPDLIDAIRHAEGVVDVRDRTSYPPQD
ncbi:MAG TPA: CBS domain-containing protein [Streptosporangiaceae bacterium]|nr:CBS domain-containing protein [Streptosporangiaceae bacterium]